MHTKIIKEKTGHEFERKHGGLYRKVWREERQGRNVVIVLFIISKMK